MRAAWVDRFATWRKELVVKTEVEDELDARLVGRALAQLLEEHAAGVLKLARRDDSEAPGLRHGPRTVSPVRFPDRFSAWSVEGRTTG